SFRFAKHRWAVSGGAWLQTVCVLVFLVARSEFALLSLNSRVPSAERLSLSAVLSAASFRFAKHRRAVSGGGLGFSRVCCAVGRGFAGGVWFSPVVFWFSPSPEVNSLSSPSSPAGAPAQLSCPPRRSSGLRFALRNIGGLFRGGLGYRRFVCWFSSSREVNS